MVSQSRGLGEASSSSSPPGSTHVTTALISSVPNGGGNGVTKSCKNRSNPADFELDLTDFDKGPSKIAADHGKKVKKSRRRYALQLDVNSDFQAE